MYQSILRMYQSITIKVSLSVFSLQNAEVLFFWEKVLKMTYIKYACENSTTLIISIVFYEKIMTRTATALSLSLSISLYLSLSLLSLSPLSL